MIWYDLMLMVFLYLCWLAPGQCLTHVWCLQNIEDGKKYLYHRETDTLTHGNGVGIDIVGIID